MSKSVCCQSERLFSGRDFPEFPFADSEWIGFLLNRDLYGAPGIPKEVFDEISRAVSLRIGSQAFLFESPLIPLGSHGGFSSRILAGWEEYRDFISTLSFCPEYYLLGPEGSVVYWFDQETVLVGGDPAVLGRAIESLGGEDVVRKRSAEDFGLHVDDCGSDMVAYIRKLLPPK